VREGYGDWVSTYESAIDGAHDKGHDSLVDVPHPPIAAPLPEVTTERLELGRFAVDDLDELASLFTNVEIWRFPYGRGFTRSETEEFLDAQMRHWNDFGFGCWVARERRSGRVIGYVGLSVPRFLPEILPAVEVGWRFHPDEWGKGFATEAATAALHEAFTTMALDEVCSVPQADNPASARVAERLGMRLARTAVIPANDRRGEVTGLLYEMTRDEWLAAAGESRDGNPQ
jgi:RimJ/RimL family protein N-acetyltransferase